MTRTTAPLTQQQQAVWTAQQLQPMSDQYNVPVAYRLSGPVDVAALDHALVDVLRTHPVLRVSVDESPSGMLEQTVHPCPTTLLCVRPTAESRLMDAVAEAARTPFAPDAHCRMRAHLFVADQQQSALVLTFDHLAVDAPSLHIVLRQLESAYRDRAGATRSVAPPELPGYFTYAREQRTWFSGEEGQEASTFWSDHVKGVAQEALFDPEASSTTAGPSVTAHTPVEIPPDFLGLTGDLHLTPFASLMAALSVTLRCLYSTEEVLIAYPAVDFRRGEYEAVVGLFTQMLLYRTRPTEGHTLASYASQVQNGIYDCLDQQGASLDAMWSTLRESQVLERGFPVMLSLNHADGEALKLPGIEAEQILVAPRAAKAGLLLSVNLHEGVATGRLDFRTDVYDAEAAARVARTFSLVLEQLLAGGERRVEDIELVQDAERELLLAEFARGRVAGREPEMWCAAFQRHVASSPDAVALVTDGGEVTYGELDRLSRILAGRLAACGLPQGSPVAICLPRSVEFVVAVVAVLRRGLAYLPVDSNQPPRRRRLILADVGAKAAVVQAGVPEDWLPPDVRAVTVTDQADDPAETYCDADVTGDTPAYLITTSGTTGLPKAVVVPHRAIANNLAWKATEFGLTHQDRFYFKTPPVFDASVWEYLSPLMLGASVVVASPDAHRDPGLLIDDISGHGVTVAQFVPTLLKLVMAEGGGLSGCAGLRLLFCGGEPLDGALVRAVRETHGARVVNLYGPTETTIDATFEECRPTTDSGVVPIGRPIQGAEVYVLGGRGHLLPLGTTGELYIGGAPLALGYAGRARRNAESFVPHLFSDDDGARLYRTGDLVRFRPDGSLEFLGRKDGQVKLRGLRVDLNGIRSLLCDHPAVVDAAAVIPPNTPDTLVAYVVTKDELDLSVLREHLAARLPAELLPSRICQLTELPLTASGKLDVRALPMPQAGHAAADASRPRTALEGRLAELWAQMLDVPVTRVPRDVSFFELGGNSLALIRLHRRLREEFPSDVQVTDLFKYPTVAAVADFLRANESHR